MNDKTLTPSAIALVSGSMIQAIQTAFPGPALVGWLTTPFDVQGQMLHDAGMKVFTGLVAELTALPGMEAASSARVEEWINTQLTAELLLAAIRGAKDLVSLQRILRFTDNWIDDNNLPDSECVFTYEDIPSFGGDEPDGGVAAYSWDATHMLVDWGDWDIEERESEDDSNVQRVVLHDANAGL